MSEMYEGSLRKIHCYSEDGELKEVIFGRIDDYRLPGYDPIFDFSGERTVNLLKKAGGKLFSEGDPDWYKLANDQLETVVDFIKSRGIVVHRGFKCRVRFHGLERRPVACERHCRTGSPIGDRLKGHALSRPANPTPHLRDLDLRGRDGFPKECLQRVVQLAHRFRPHHRIRNGSPSHCPRDWLTIPSPRNPATCRDQAA